MYVSLVRQTGMEAGCIEAGILQTEAGIAVGLEAGKAVGLEIDIIDIEAGIDRGRQSSGLRDGHRSMHRQRQAKQ
jgi:hypothetical protein